MGIRYDILVEFVSRSISIVKDTDKIQGEIDAA